MFKKWTTAAVALLLASATCQSQATTNSNRVDVTLTAQILTSLSIVVAVPTVAFGVVTPGASNAAPVGQAVSVVSTWSLAAGNTVKLYAYFDTASSAMTGTLTGSLIPVSAFTGSVNGGTSTTFSGTNPFGGPALAVQMFSQTLTAGTAVGSRTDSLAMTMNLAGLSTLQADNYTGTMHVQAQAM